MSYIYNIENYPPDYHLGISLFFWLIYIVEVLIFAMIMIYRAHKDRLINKKEMFFGAGLTSLGSAIVFILMQIGVVYPTYFALYISIGLTILQFTFVFWVYYWEKNLISLKKIPTIISIGIFFMAFIDMIFILTINSSALEFFEISYVVFMVLIQFLFIYVLVILFAKRVVGNLRIKAVLVLIGLILVLMGAMFDHPPVVFLLPGYLTLITPFIFIVSIALLYYGFIGICEGISTFYNQEQICLIHRGVIKKGTLIYYCPSCNTTYCLKCYEQVIKREGCWNCGQGFKPIQEKEWKSEEVSIIDPKKEHKSKSPK